MQDKGIRLLDLSRANSANFPVLATFPIRKGTYQLSSVAGVVWKDAKPVLIDSRGFYF